MMADLDTEALGEQHMAGDFLPRGDWGDVSLAIVDDDYESGEPQDDEGVEGA
jgi:hypothetical protein